MDRFTKPKPRTGPTRLAFHVSRIVIDAGVLIAMAAMSMQFVTTEDTVRDSVAADALPVVLLLAPVFLLTLLPDHSRPIHIAAAWVSVALILVALPFAVVKYLDAANLAATLGGTVGFGPRLLIFGAAVAGAGVGVGIAADSLPSSGDRGKRPRTPATPRGATTAPRGRAGRPNRSKRSRPVQTAPRPAAESVDPRRSPATPVSRTRLEPRSGSGPDHRSGER